MKQYFFNLAIILVVICGTILNLSFEYRERTGTDQKVVYDESIFKVQQRTFNYKTRKEKLNEDFQLGIISQEKYKADLIALENDDHEFAEVFVRGMPGPAFPGCKQNEGEYQNINACTKEKLTQFIQNQLNLSKTRTKTHEISFSFIVSPKGKISKIGVEEGLEIEIVTALQNAVLELNNYENWSPAWYSGQKIFVTSTVKLLIDL